MAIAFLAALLLPERREFSRRPAERGAVTAAGEVRSRAATVPARIGCGDSLSWWA